MAELAAYTGVNPITTTATAVAQARGIRVTVDSSGTTAASAIGVRGDFVTLTAIAASGVGAGSPMQTGSIVPALASEACTVGSAAYSAAAGKFSQTSGGGAILVGKWVLAASGDGVLGEVLLSNPA